MVPCRTRLTDVHAGRGELTLWTGGTNAIGAAALARGAYTPWRTRRTARTACHGTANRAEFAVCAILARGCTSFALEAANITVCAATSPTTRLVPPSRAWSTNTFHRTTAACVRIASWTILIACTARAGTHSSLELPARAPLALRLSRPTMVVPAAQSEQPCDPFTILKRPGEHT